MYEKIVYFPSFFNIFYKVQKVEYSVDKKIILKYQKLARFATHTNDSLRNIADVDLTKSL